MEEKEVGSDTAVLPKLILAVSTDDDDKKEKRREANRRSAKKSRYREGVMVDELQRQCREFGEHNAVLRGSNDALRKMIEYMKVSSLRRTAAAPPVLVRR